MLFKICPICKNSFEDKSPNKTKVYCSKECKSEALQLRRRSPVLRAQFGGWKNYKCKRCGCIQTIKLDD